MTLTEEDAKTKRCQEGFGPPFFDPREFSGLISASGVSGAIIHSPSHCIGSACMAWRWDGEIQYEQGSPLPVDSTPADLNWEKDGEPFWLATGAHPKGGGYMQRWHRPLPGVGYCGKAGKP